MTFLKMTAAAALCVSAVLGAATPAAAADKMVLKATDVHPLGYPTVEAVVQLGKKLEKATRRAERWDGRRLRWLDRIGGAPHLTRETETSAPPPAARGPEG